MAYLIGLIIVSMVLAPVLWIMPSPKQKRQMALRQKAMATGLQVKVCDIPQTYREQVRKEAPKKGVAYILLCPNLGKGNEKFDYIYFRDGDDGGEQKNTKLSESIAVTLKQLPESVVAVGYSNIGLSIYWNEAGSAELVDTIHQQLTLLKNEIATNIV